MSMKYRVATIACILICFLLSGCSSWMDGEYLSVSPHREKVNPAGSNPVEVSSYEQMLKMLNELVESGADNCVMSMPFNSATVHQYANAAVSDVMSANPFAAYAVKKITFDVGTNRGTPVIAFRINYRMGRAEILQIRQTSSMDEAQSLIINALDNCDNSIVLRIKHYTDTDFEQLVHKYADDHPDKVMELPQVKVAIYPEHAKDCIVSMQFTYNTNRKDLQLMQQQVKLVFTSAELYVKETSQIKEIYSRLYSFLMERNDYTIETSITPAYSLLQHGVGDSRAFASVYAAMCRQANLDCQVVSGTRNGEAWCWNVVGFRGSYYHVDLLRCMDNGGFQMLKASDMDGYVWDYSLYAQE